MTWVDNVFFIYTFLGLYMTGLFIIIYLLNRKTLFDYPKGRPEPVSIILPCYNASKTIGHAIESLLSLNYPKNMIEVIVVDDKSKDDSVEIVKKYTKKYKNVRLIVNKRNSGGAAEPTNIGIKAAKYAFIAVADDDSTPEPDALIKMIGQLQSDKTVGGVTCSVIAKSPKKFIQKLQEIEYYVIGFNRKLLDCVDAVYVTPGPFALYRKSVLFEIGLFDTKNMTQDIEIVWRMNSYGYKARMSLDAKVYTETPSKFRQWWRQRVRWNIGGTQCILKYRNVLFKRGMLGAFIVPFFSLSLFIGLFGFGLFIYLFLRGLFVSYLSTRYSVEAAATILRFDELTFTPSILNYFGIVLFLLGLIITLIILSATKSSTMKNKNIFNVLFYLLVYLTIYPLVLISSIYRMVRGNYKW